MPMFAKLAAGLLIALGITGVPTFCRRILTDQALHSPTSSPTSKPPGPCRTPCESGHPQPFRVSLMEPGLSRTVMPGGSVSIQNHLTGSSIVLDPSRKSVLLIDRKPVAIMDPITSQIQHLRNFRR